MRDHLESLDTVQKSCTTGFIITTVISESHFLEKIMEVCKQISGQTSKIKLQFYQCHTENLTILIVFLLQILQKYH